MVTIHNKKLPYRTSTLSVLFCKLLCKYGTGYLSHNLKPLQPYCLLASFPVRCEKRHYFRKNIWSAATLQQARSESNTYLAVLETAVFPIKLPTCTRFIWAVCRHLRQLQVATPTSFLFFAGRFRSFPVIRAHGWIGVTGIEPVTCCV